MNTELINRIAATIRRVDGNHTMGAGALAEAIVEDFESDLRADLPLTEELLDAAVEALIADGWEETHDGGTLSRQDLLNVARVVLRARSGL
jgi:hypothetical protein